MSIEKFIKEAPKAELHLHIEGSFQPELLFKIAERNQIEIPYKTVSELKEAYRFSGLQDFLDIYYTGAGVLVTEEDFYDLTMAYFEACDHDHIIFTEIMFDPQTHTKRGIAFETVINGIHKAQLHAKEKYGIDSLLIMSFLRHLSEEDAFETLEQALPYKHLIKSVGLDSSEKGNPPSKFQKVYDAAIKEGFLPVAHAGEEGPADYIWQALELLKIKRIDHGNNCLSDERLVQHLVEKDLALTVCPLSNLELKVVENLADHPLKIMLDKGLKVTVNSDDPAYFGGYLTENLLQIQQALNLSKADIVQLLENAFNYSFADAEQKKSYLQKLKTFEENFED